MTDSPNSKPLAAGGKQGLTQRGESDVWKLGPWLAPCGDCDGWCLMRGVVVVGHFRREDFDTWTRHVLAGCPAVELQSP